MGVSPSMGPLNDAVCWMSTIIGTVAVDGNVSQASGFYFQLSTAVPEHPGYQRVDGTFLVTNRHVMLPEIDGNETMPVSITFHLRMNVNGSIEWYPVVLSGQDMIDRVRLHPTCDVDVAVIDVTDILIEKAIEWGYLRDGLGINSTNLLAEGGPRIGVGDDVLVVGYPLGHYDSVNKIPIVKSGIIATRWGSNYEGEPAFLIDAKLFPGSSGSAVLSKPRYLEMFDGQLMGCKDGAYYLLGVFSGEEMHVDEVDGGTSAELVSYGIGKVWYPWTILETISHGVGFEDAIPRRHRF